MARALEVAASQRRRSEALVGFRIFLVADTDMLGVEEPDHGCENRLAREIAPLEVLLDLPAEARQRLSELQQPLVLGALPLRPEVGMVAVLLPTPCIDPGRLHVTIGILAEPGVGVGWRKADRV